jgi:hypothetical protein
MGGGFFYSLLAGFSMVVPNAWWIKNIRWQRKIDTLLHDDDEEAFGFSAQGIRGRGGIAATF